MQLFSSVLDLNVHSLRLHILFFAIITNIHNFQNLGKYEVLAKLAINGEVELSLFYLTQELLGP